MSNLIITNKVYEKYSGEPRMFFGEGRGIQEFIDTPYPEFLKLKDQQFLFLLILPKDVVVIQKKS